MRRSYRVRSRQRAAGFSLLEMMVVVALIIVVGSITFVSLIPLLKAQRVTNAYNITLAAMRQARDNAVSQRTSYSVNFVQSTSAAATITVAPTLSTAFSGEQNSVTYTLPTDVGFYAISGIPTGATTVPDGYGAGATAIDFGYTYSGTGSGGTSTIYFCPDGSSQDGTGGVGACTGNWSGGVVYVARQGEILSSRAITLWGGTGRIHGWRLYNKTGGGYLWLRQ